MGPFQHLPISNLQVSPVGVVPKSDGVSWRFITHLSYPSEGGINDYIDKIHCTVRYTSFDRVIEMISKLGKRAELGVHDIKSAFRLLPVHPGDFDLLGFKIEDKYYVNKCLPMGCAVSCKIFEKFSTFLHWLVEKKTGLNTLDHYLDDFIFVGKERTNQCKKLMGAFSSLCKDLGIPIAENKSVGPVTVLTFLGLEIDTEEMVIRVPKEKCDLLVSELEYYLKQDRITLKKLQSLVGSLNFFGKAIRCARAFNRRFYDLTTHVKRPHHFIKLNLEVKEDIEVWLQFLKSYDGKTYFPESCWTDNDVIQLFTDSAGGDGKGCGAYFSGKWSFFEWPSTWSELGILRDITFLELVPVVLSMEIWGNQLQNKKIMFHIDNIALVDILNSQTSKSKRVMSLVRPFVLCTLQNNIIFRAKHIAGKYNDIADSISRQQWERFRRLAPMAQQNPDEVPDSFHQLFCNMK